MNLAELVADTPALRDWASIHAWRGSVAHGMFDGPHPDSIDDKDTIAVVVPSIGYFYGLKEFGSKGTQERKVDVWDTVIYDVRKTLRMLAQGNPNILSLLWLPDSGYINVNAGGQLILDSRKLFTGRWCYKSFVGYAKGQMHKMTHGAKQGYMGEKRQLLVERHGYDCKNAAHLIRLLRMACEFLRDGELIVDRGGLDATELLDIKHGDWTLEQVQAEAQRLFARADAIYDKCSLPSVPDMDAINQLCMEVVFLELYERSEA